jgi:amino acid permease
MGFIVYLVMCGLGEMATWLPRSSGFTGYAVRFCDPALGFALGYTYVANDLIRAQWLLTGIWQILV